MTLTLTPPEQPPELKPRIIVFGIGGAGGNAVNNMIRSNLEGVECVVANTDAQALSQCLAERKVQLGLGLTQGLGAGSRPEVGRAAAEEGMEELISQIQGGHMVFVTAGMGGGTGTGAAPVIAAAARELGLLTVGVVTKPFHFEGSHRMELADEGISNLEKVVDTLIVIPNQNLFKVADEKTTFTDAFQMADEVLYAGVRGVTELMISPGLINLDFADIRSIMDNGGKAMMGSGEADGESRALASAEAAIANPLLEDSTLSGASGCLINITGGPDLTLYEVDEAANRIRDEVDPSANIIFGSVLDEALEGRMRVSIFATGVDSTGVGSELPAMGTATRTPSPPPAPAGEPEDDQISILSSSIGTGETAGPDDDASFDDGEEAPTDGPAESLTIGTADPVRISPAASRQSDEPDPIAMLQDPAPVDPPAEPADTLAEVAEPSDADEMSDPADDVQPFGLSTSAATSLDDPALDDPMVGEARSDHALPGRPALDADAEEDLPPWPEAVAGQPDMFSQKASSSTQFGMDPAEAAMDVPDPSVSSNRSLRQTLLADDQEPNVLEDDTPEFLQGGDADGRHQSGRDKGAKRSFLSRLVNRSANDKHDDGDADADGAPPANDETAEAPTPHFGERPAPVRAAVADPVESLPSETPTRSIGKPQGQPDGTPQGRLSEDGAIAPPERSVEPERSPDMSATVVLDSNRNVSPVQAESAQAEPAKAPLPAFEPAPRRQEAPAPVSAPAAEPQATTSGASAPSDDELLEIPAFLRRQSN